MIVVMFDLTLEERLASVYDLARGWDHRIEVSEFFEFLEVENGEIRSR